MYFMLLILVTAGLVGTAAFFSVVGIASMFAYNYTPALIMGIMLESGKIAVAVYLYRYWRMIAPLFKSILIMFMVVLMFITSVGVFGYLSQGYQKTSEEFKIMSLELKSLEDEYTVKKARETEINKQIEQLPGEFVGGKIRLAREFADEQAELRDRLAVVEPRIQELRVKRLAFESHLGPISYVARMIELPQDTVVFYAILMLVFVADPLAVTLTVACNMALIRFWDKRARPRALPEESGGVFDSFVERARTVAMKSYGVTFDKHDTKLWQRPAKKRAGKRGVRARAKRR
jgi:cell division protein FtsB